MFAEHLPTKKKYVFICSYSTLLSLLTGKNSGAAKTSPSLVIRTKSRRYGVDYVLYNCSNLSCNKTIVKYFAQSHKSTCLRQVMSRRPPSSLSHRPPSSLAVPRPVSSASSIRPHSRLSQRPQRHARSRLVPLSQALVTQVTGLRDEGTEDDFDGENFRTAVDFVAKNLEATTLTKAAAGMDMGAIDRQIRGCGTVRSCWLILG